MSRKCADEVQRGRRVVPEKETYWELVGFALLGIAALRTGAGKLSTSQSSPADRFSETGPRPRVARRPVLAVDGELHQQVDESPDIVEDARDCEVGVCLAEQPSRNRSCQRRIGRTVTVAVVMVLVNTITVLRSPLVRVVNS